MTSNGGHTDTESLIIKLASGLVTLTCAGINTVWLHPLASVTVSLMEYVPVVEYVCTGDIVVDELPSPKSQIELTMPPVEVLVNVTGLLTHGLTLEAVNEAVG